MSKSQECLLYLSADRIFEEKIVSAFPKNYFFIRSKECCLRILDEKSIDIMLVDERAFIQNNNIVQTGNELLKFYKLAIQKNKDLVFIVLKHDPRTYFKEVNFDGTGILFLDIELLSEERLSYIFRVFRKRNFETILNRDVKVGSKYPSDLYHYQPESGKYVIFLERGNPLEKNHKNLLVDTGIEHLYVGRDKILNLFDKTKGISTFSVSEVLYNIRKKYETLLTKFFDVRNFTSDSEEIKKIGEGIVNDYVRLIHNYGSNIDALRELTFPRWGRMAHGLNSCLYSLIFAKAGQIKNEEEVAWTCLVHNIGMADLPKELHTIDEKKMTASEFLKYSGHVQKSLDIISNKKIEISPIILNCIKYHHENFDGTGFPEGLSGEEIPIEGNYLSLVSSYNFFNTVRPGEKTRTCHEAFRALLAYQHQGSPLGEKFHPRLLACINQFFEKK